MTFAARRMPPKPSSGDSFLSLLSGGSGGAGVTYASATSPLGLKGNNSVETSILGVSGIIVPPSLVCDQMDWTNDGFMYVYIPLSVMPGGTDVGNLGAFSSIRVQEKFGPGLATLNAVDATSGLVTLSGSSYRYWKWARVTSMAPGDWSNVRFNPV